MRASYRLPTEEMLRHWLTSDQMDTAVRSVQTLLEEDPSPVNYANLHELFSSVTDNCALDETQRVRVALLSSFTIDPLKPYLYFECARDGLFSQFYVAGFDQYAQEILNPDSELYRFQPELTILGVHTEALLAPLLEKPFTCSPFQKEQMLEAAVAELDTLAETFCTHSKGLLLIHNLLVPSASMYGILDNKLEGGQVTLVRVFNEKLAARLARHRQVYTFDFEGVAGNFGKARCQNMKMWYLAQMYLSDSFVPHLAATYMRYIKPLKTRNRKCVVLDLDNTLWGGTIGEDGIDGIELDLTPPGNAYRDFQLCIKGLSERGIILAVNSKNNFDDAIEVIRHHPYMVLREDDFACLKINWQDKVANLREIAEELNIGLDSIVFVDDNPAERLLVRDYLPQVLTVELPSDPALYRRWWEGLTDFETLTLTEEDWGRGRMYVDDRKRNEQRQAAPSLEDFLRNLEMQVDVKQANAFTIPRIAQLTQRTNQFTLTTRRYNEAHIHAFCDSTSYKVYSVGVKDRFGDNGIVGAAIVEQSGTTCRIDTFLMSCRVIGRQIENTLLTKIARDAHAAGIQQMIGEYLPTPKNVLVKDFYAKMGFQQSAGQQWSRVVCTTHLVYPSFIQVCED
jgi:FkbH-like protein